MNQQDTVHDGMLTWHISKFRDENFYANPSKLKLIMRLDFLSLKGGKWSEESIATAQQSGMGTPEFESEMIRQMKMQLKSMLLDIMQTGKITYEDENGDLIEKTIDAIWIGNVETAMR